MSQYFVVVAFYNAGHVVHATIADLDIASVENFVKGTTRVKMFVDELEEDFADIC